MGKLGKRKKKCEDESNTTYTGRDCSARDFRDEFKTLTHWRSLHSKNKGVRDSLIKIIQGVEVVGARAVVAGYTSCLITFGLAIDWVEQWAGHLRSWSSSTKNNKKRNENKH